MIQAFKQLNWPDWRLIVAGGGLKKPTEIYNAMGEIDQKQVQFVYNPSFPELSRLYGQASIYWHAAGFGEDLAVHPEKAEHFGMTTVEAMSAGAVPLVYAGGGQKEIIMDGVNGRWWQTPAKLIKLTRLIGANHDLWQALSEKARIRAKTFSEEVFADGFVQLVR